eukprot:EG_transcript_7153
MLSSRRRPFGDIGNTYNAQQATSKPKLPAPAPFRIPSLGSTTSLTPSETTSPVSPRFDEKNKGNHLHTTEYVRDIFDYLNKAQIPGRPSPNYMKNVQTDINEKMRTILVDWLVDVHLKFKLQPETLFLAIECIDRFLEKKMVSRQKLQLVGVVGMLLAAKYEEIYPPEVKDFIYIAANTYSREDILRMERLMFSTLDFNLTFPTIYPFLKRALQVIDADCRTQQLAQCLAELSLTEFKMLQHSPSLIGASCVYLANKYQGRDPWCNNLDHYSQCKLADVERCAADILTICQNSPNQKTQAVRKKYSYPKFGEVTRLITGL